MSSRACRTAVSVAVCAACGVIGALAATNKGEGTPFHGFWPVYLVYLVVAVGVGFLHSYLAWMAGAAIMPAHWIVVIASGAAPTTSTMGVGHLFTLLLSVPLALASHLGGRASRVSSQ